MTVAGVGLGGSSSTERRLDRKEQEKAREERSSCGQGTDGEAESGCSKGAGREGLTLLLVLGGGFLLTGRQRPSVIQVLQIPLLFGGIQISWSCLVSDCSITESWSHPKSDHCPAIFLRLSSELHARQCFKYFTRINPSDPHENSLKTVLKCVIT